MPTILRPMSTGELLDQTFRLYRNHFVLFVGIAALPNLGVLAISVITDALTRAGVFARMGATGTVVAFVGGALVLYAAYLVALAASHAATVTAVSALHLDKPITIHEAYARVKGKMLHLAGIILATWLGIGLGFVLLIIPGIILALKWALTVPVAVMEDAGLAVATSRSSDLTQGSKGRIFVIGFLCVVLMYIVAIVVEMPVFVIVGVSAAKHGAMPVWVEGLARVLNFVASSLVGPVLTIALSLVYFDERVRKEGLDLEVLMGDFGNDASTAAAGV